MQLTKFSKSYRYIRFKSGAGNLLVLRLGDFFFSEGMGVNTF